jgi:hypothetical protein
MKEPTSIIGKLTNNSRHTDWLALRYGNRKPPLFSKIFDLCVTFLDNLAELLGTTYERINVWIFCIIWPLYTIFITTGFLYLLFKE